MKFTFYKFNTATIIYYMLSLTIFIDYVNGIFPTSHIGELFRIILILVSLYIVLKYNGKNGVWTFLFVGYLLISSIIFIIYYNYSLFGFIYDCKMLLKITLYIILFCAISSLYKQGKFTSIMLKKIIVNNLLYTPLLFLAASILNIGKLSYSGFGNAGFKATFLSLNSINIALIVLFVYAFCQTIFSKGWSWFLLTLYIAFPMLLLGTKTSLILGLFIPIIVIVANLKYRKTWIIVLCFLLGGSALLWFFGSMLFSKFQDIFNRQLVLLGERDIITYLLSTRNYTLDLALEYYTKHIGFWGKIFGAGYYYTHNQIATTMFSNSIIRPIEMDWADLIIAYGPVSLAFTYGHSIWILCRSRKYKMAKNVQPFYLSSLLLIAFSMFAGHVFIEAISSTFFALSIIGVYIFAKEEATVQHRYDPGNYNVE